MDKEHIDQLTLGEKMGRVLQLSESTDKRMDSFALAMDKKMDKFIEACDKRFCACEKSERNTELFIANVKGKVSMLGIIWGSISGIGSALIVWYLTKVK